ncbi:unnamed protein product [Orchesella dallaii]|uniref:Peptidase S1 domain-containing protein n=1 Tax=Orchesella dallaii TaxID=48710 RepID=A0ABP1Q808_9HEXA
MLTDILVSGVTNSLGIRHVMVMCTRITVIFLIGISLSSSHSGKHEILQTDCECGVKNLDIVRRLPKGMFAGNHAWPWMASIVNITIADDPSAYCGATLINNRYILTAAHCIPDMRDTGIDNFRIYLGTNLIDGGTDFLDLGIDTINSHPNFNFDTAENDICLIKLSESVEFTSYINPICLRQSGSPFVDRMGYITGWGSFNLTEHTENALKESEVVVVSNEICAKNYSSEDIPVTDNMLCAALPEEDPCKGDSGGPLIVKCSSTDTFTQIGIISHGEGCAVQDFPAIFTRVSSFIDWIQQNTQDGVYCERTFS